VNQSGKPIINPTVLSWGWVSAGSCLQHTYPQSQYVGMWLLIAV
jgi:hypothetical protein